MHYRTLGRTGLRVSVLGFGASPFGDVYGQVDTQELDNAVSCAIDLGINFFDVAPYYGLTLAETRLGKALKGRRHQVILATKCGRYGLTDFDFSAAKVTRTADESLERLQTDYLDILHVHDIEFGSKYQIVEETIPALRRLQQAGKVRFVGVTGLALKMLREVIAEVKVDCVLSYCRYTLLNRDLEEDLAPFTRTQGIGLINASPLHMRLLSDAGPPPWHPAPQAVKDTAWRIVKHCHARGSRAEEIALQFAVSNPDLASTLVGMSDMSEVKSNVQSLERTPDTDLLREIDEIAQPVRKLTWLTGKAENH